MVAMPLLMTPGLQRPLLCRLLRRADRLGPRRLVRYLTTALLPLWDRHFPLLMMIFLDAIPWGTGENLLPYDVGPILLNLVRDFPGSFGRYVRDSLKPQLREHMATMGGRLQRDLLPLPRPAIVETDVVRDGDDLSDLNWEALHCRLVVTVLALNWEAGFRSLKFARHCRRRPNAAQRAALAALGRRLYLATRIETSLPAELDWEDRLKDRKIGYGGAEITAPHKLTLEQVLDGLPPPGVAASIEAADVATGFVRDALLDPGLVLLPPALRRAAPTSARVWASEGEWHRIVEALHERGMVGPISASDIACRDGSPLLNGALGVPKAHDAPAKCQDGMLRPVLRLITNLIPSNAGQECIVGDTPEMPTMSQLNGLVLTESEDLLWSGADRKAFFYVFRAAPPWWPHTVIGLPAPSRLLGLKDGGTTHISLRVIGMGWSSAAGVTTHLHRNALLCSGAVPRGLSPSCEITRRRRLPLGAEKPCPPAWMGYIDNLEIAEIVDKSEADKLRGTVPELLTDARVCYEAAGARRASMRLIRILLGRWVRAHCFRRPLAASFAYTWKWLNDPRCGGRFSVSVIEDLLMCLALSGLCVADMRLDVDHLVTASDASEAAGAVVHSAGLTERGRVVAGRRQRPANAACEEETALITVFDGIGGGRRAFEILGLVPAVQLSFEVDPQAVRVARRAYPGTQHLGDVTSADPAALAGLLRARGRVARVVVIGGFPCQIYASLNVDRKGSSDSRASLVDHMVRVIRGLRAAMPEVSVDFPGENAASMAESDVLHLCGLFERIPLEVEAGDIGWVRRPRLYWPSWDLLPSCEAKTVMVLTKDGASRRRCRVSLEVERPPLEEWLPAGARCPGAEGGEPLPTFVRWAPRSQPRPRPAGIGERTAAELTRWEEAAFAAPPCQFRDRWCICWPDGRIAPPDAVMREKLMGFAEGHTAPCMTSSAAKSEPSKYEGLRRSLIGNSFQCEVVAWLLAHWAVAAGLLVAVPPFSELRESARAWAGGRKLWAGDVTSLRRSRAEVDAEVRDELVACSAAAPAERQQAGEEPAAAAPAAANRLVYVGRGSRRWGLAPSCFGSPFAVGPSCSREDAVALFAGWLRKQPELLRRLEDLRGAKLVCHCSQSEACHADVLLAELAKRDAASWRDADVSRRLVMGLVMACHSNGADLRGDGSSEEFNKVFPRQEIDAGLWQWRKARQLVWDVPEHINVLECQGALMMIRWRARSLGRQQRVFLHLLDSMVNIGALSKHRSSSSQLNKVVRSLSAWELATGGRAVFGFTSSARNPADAPSRQKEGEAVKPRRQAHGQSWPGEAARCPDRRCRSCWIPSSSQQFVGHLNAMNLPLPFNGKTRMSHYKFTLLWAKGATRSQANVTLSLVQHLLRTRQQYSGAHDFSSSLAAEHNVVAMDK
ncbi:unnamed protein product, partial [Prorocentrum cordatum]